MWKTPVWRREGNTMPRAPTDVVILDGRRGGETSTDPAFKALTDEIASRGLPCRVFDLRAMPIGACNGCFGCWVKTPGQCVQDDPAREVARACARADLVERVRRRGAYGLDTAECPVDLCRRRGAERDSRPR